MCKDLGPNFGDSCIMTMHHLTSFFTKNNMTVIRHAPYFSLFPQLKIKLKVYNFDTSGVIDAESQVVLNTLTEHNFQDTLKKNGRSAENGAYARKGTTSRLMVASMPKVSFDQNGSISPGNYGWLFAFYFSSSSFL
jgi:hypothetical protein